MHLKNSQIILEIFGAFRCIILMFVHFMWRTILCTPCLGTWEPSTVSTIRPPMQWWIQGKERIFHLPEREKIVFFTEVLDRKKIVINLENFWVQEQKKLKNFKNWSPLQMLLHPWQYHYFICMCIFELRNFFNWNWEIDHFLELQNSKAVCRKLRDWQKCGMRALGLSQWYVSTSLSILDFLKV